MSKLEQLIKDLCPDGVEYTSLGEILINNNASDSVSKNDYKEVGKIPIIDQSQAYIAAYTDNESAIPPAFPCIIFGDHTRVVKYADKKFAQGDSGTKVFIPVSDDINAKYIYYAFCNLNIPSRGYNRHWTIVKDITIPLPPLPVQEEIVHILDNFTELTAELTTELTTELTARKKQYQYYRDSLLTFGNEVKWKELGNFGEIRMCKRILKEQTLDIGDIPFYKIGTFGKEPNAYIPYKLFDEYRSKYNYPKIGEVLISASGTIGRSVIFDGQDAYFQDSNIVWIETNETQVLNKYLFHSYKIARWIISEGGTIQRLYNNNLKKTKIPIRYPNDTDKSLLEQQRIVDILDRFDTLCNDIEIRLPAEIKARKQQYEYYRDKLLTFPKVDKGV